MLDWPRTLSQDTAQFAGLAGVLAQQDASQAGKFVAVDLVDCTATAMRRESQDVVEIGPAFQRVLEPHGPGGWAEIDQRPHSDVPPVGGCARYSAQFLAVGFVAEKQVAALDLITQVTKAGGALDPAFVAHGIDAAGSRAEILIKAPAALRIDFENPDSHGLSWACSIR